jgi:hypothetical protein
MRRKGRRKWQVRELSMRVAEPVLRQMSAVIGECNCVLRTVRGSGAGLVLNDTGGFVFSDRRSDHHGCNCLPKLSPCLTSLRYHCNHVPDLTNPPPCLLSFLFTTHLPRLLRIDPQIQPLHLLDRKYISMFRAKFSAVHFCF